MVTMNANAALVSRLNGQVVYDTDLGISWITDTNLSASNTFGLPTNTSLGTYPSDTSGVNGEIQVVGSMNYPAALFWIDAMNSSSYLGFNDWRLPSTLQPDAGCSIQDSLGSRQFGCTGSELGHLHYNEFDATANSSALDGNPAELAKFSDIIGGPYWTGQQASVSGAWMFNFSSGGQFVSPTLSSLLVIAVRSGDVAVVPVPVAFWLFSSGLVGLIGFARKKVA